MESNNKMKIAFIWQGISGRYGQWQDGLYAAMQIIGKKHEVRVFEPEGNIEAFNPDWVLYWEAPITYQSNKDGDKYKRIQNLPFKKALLFAGGEIKPMWMQNFDHIFVESQIDMDTCERFGLPHSRAFGINDQIMKPQKQPKIWDAMHQATCASWKRTWLMTEVFKDKSLLCGRFQESDPNCWIRARENNALVLPEQSAESVASLLNASYCMAQTSEFWGGGQRATLEAISCGIPVIAMSDSPKNCEFIRESGYGIICDPKPELIKDAFQELMAKKWDIEVSQKYIRENWTAKIYANDILKVLE